ncbi:amidase family protein [Maricurvus nonylphenolicus]|uniref:amidase n=1 Tax=Maricurvus nonylphenolicus TaxID=1008307 RepID=UPI0036F3E643
MTLPDYDSSYYNSYDALGLAGLVESGEVSPAELLEEAIIRTEYVNGELNAVTATYYEQARKAAQSRLPQGPFRGVPFLIKDAEVLMKDHVTTTGSASWEGDVADHDSTLVQRYKNAGVVIFGRTNCPELALKPVTEPEAYGPTRNPWNLERTPGGSSGGAAAAVAAGIVPVAHATDGGGSIRMPSSCCGLVGLKPSRGRIPHGPDHMESWGGQSTGHVISRSVRDSAAMLDATAGADVGDSYAAPEIRGTFLDAVYRSPGQLKIAISREKWGPGDYSPEVLEGLEKTISLLEDMGHIVEEARPDINGELASAAGFTVISVSAALALKQRARQLGCEVDALPMEAGTRSLLEFGRSISSLDYAEAIQTNHGLARSIGQFMQRYDLILAPTMATPPVPIGYLNAESDSEYTRRLVGFMGDTTFFNQTGQPSISLPLYWTDDGLPVGMMFSAAYGREDVLLSLAGQLEQAVPWKDKKPSVYAGKK